MVHEDHDRNKLLIPHRFGRILFFRVAVSTFFSKCDGFMCARKFTWEHLILPRSHSLRDAVVHHVVVLLQLPGQLRVRRAVEIEHQVGAAPGEQTVRHARVARCLRS